MRGTGTARTLLLGVGGLTALAVGMSHQHPRTEPPLSRPETVEAMPVRPVGPVQPVRPVQPVANHAEPLTRAAPIRIRIPRIGVDSTLLRLGQASDGSIAVPGPGPHYNQAGWYRYSPVPGAVGPAVVVGHVDSAADGPSVFFRLGSLRPHDQVQVTSSNGALVTFTVTRVLRVAKSAFPTGLVYGDTPGPELRLITCGGSFDRSTGHYRDDVVVLATLRR